MRKVLIGAITLSAVALLCVTTAPSAIASPHRASAAAHGRHHTANADPTIYDSLISPIPGSLESTSFGGTGATEYGNQIVFGGSARVLDNVVVTLDSFACQTGSGFTTSCASTPGATFTEPVTLNVYNVGANNAVGSLIVSETQTFNIPYQPSADPNYATDCAPDVVPNTYFSTTAAFAGAWYDPNVDPTTGNPIGCEFGLASNVTFSFGHILLPNSVIYGIAYDTGSFGDSPNAPQYQVGGTTPTGTPWGTSGPYDSLNVANAISPAGPTVGSDPNLGTAYVDYSAAPFGTNNYCDNGAGGNSFRIDGNPNTNDCTGTGSPYNVGYSYSMAQGLCDASGAEDAGGATVASVWAANGNTGNCRLSPYIIPAVQFNAVTSKAAIITSASTATAVAGTPFSFTITTTGVPVPTVRARGRLPKGIAFVSHGNGTATISGTAFKTNRNGRYKLTLRAANLPTGGRNRQSFTLTLTGGR